MPLPRLVLLVLCALLVLAAPAAAKPATRTYALPATATNPEGIAADQRTRTFYVTTVGDGAVYRGVQGADGPLELFLPGGQDGRTSAAGIKVDEKRRLLVIAGGPTGAVFVYDLATRALVNRIDLGGQFVNDVTILKNGDVYATESGDVDPGVFRIPAATVAGASDAFEPIDVSPRSRPRRASTSTASPPRRTASTSSSSSRTPAACSASTPGRASRPRSRSPAGR
jgi:hypothetical protein